MIEGEPAAKMKLSVAELSLATEDEQAPNIMRGALPYYWLLASSY